MMKIVLKLKTYNTILNIVLYYELQTDIYWRGITLNTP
jgi:hypothetical protein